MATQLALITLVVADYDEAISWYVNKLNFVLVEDTRLNENKRWVIIAPDNSSNTKILLAKAANGSQKASIGNQTGGRVFLFLNTNDFWKEYETMIQKGVKFVRGPVTEDYGIVAVFEDLYGNLWDLIQSAIK